jgi:ribosomal protein S18 acetylase RimI-like enzyme
MAEAALEIRRLQSADLAAYKALRDATLADDPSAFTSDAETESRKSPDAYLSRLGLTAPLDGVFTLGALRDDMLLGAVSCERDMRIKVRHIGHVVGMMVRTDRRGLGIGRLLVDACIAEARRGVGVEMLTLTVTASNAGAVHLYERAGFRRYGSLPHAIKVGDRYHSKDQMVLML